MHATVTDDLELVLRWYDGGESTVRFSLASSSEFTISCRVSWRGTLNYQGDVSISFETMCYGFDLERFRVELRRLDEGSVESASFLNTGGDFEIRIAPHDHYGRRVLLTEWRYRHYRSVIRDVSCDSELVLHVGAAEDLLWTAKSIGELIRLLDVDCRGLFELPR
jgi:hypothetical protein